MVRPSTQPQPWLVLYDGDCGLCKWLLAGLLRFDRAERLRPVALQRPEAGAYLADLDRAEWMTSMHLVSPDGTRASAGEALPALLRLLSGGRLPAAILARFPRLTSAGYRWVATHRIGISRFVPRRAKERAAERVRERELEVRTDEPGRSSSTLL
ncbi:MAG TPA: DCC1-like thiol-disulfide oxidoreductase family protein [Solirubrobacterales bacterium]